MASSSRLSLASSPLVAAGVAALLFVATSAASATDTGRLFRISRSGAPDSYVLGTIHVPDARVAEPSKAVLDALSHCRTLAVELVPEGGADLQDFEQLDGGRRLDGLIGRDAFDRLAAQLAARGDRSRLEQLKPWAAMIRLSSAGNAGSVAPLDAQVLIQAQRNRMKILPLELLDEQIAAFDTIPEASQRALLMQAIDHPATMGAGTERTVDAWLRGDLDTLARIALHDDGTADAPAMKPHYEALVANIIYGRTALMHHRLFIPLREGRVCVAIGALHLQGSKGMLALLRDDGYRIAKVW